MTDFEDSLEGDFDSHPDRGNPLGAELSPSYDGDLPSDLDTLQVIASEEPYDRIASVDSDDSLDAQYDGEDSDVLESDSSEDDAVPSTSTAEDGEAEDYGEAPVPLTSDMLAKFR